MNYQPRLPGNAKRNVLAAALGIVFSVLIGATGTQAAQPAPGGACTTGQVTGPINNSLASDANNLRCISSAWAYPVYQLGATTTACNASTAGALQWTTTSFQTCNGSSWSVLGGASLSSITPATTTSSIDSGSNAIAWAWGTLSTQNALTLTTSSMTSGNLLNLSNTSAQSGTGAVLNISSTENGTTYGVKVVMTGASNTGYAGYFSSSGGTGYAGYFGSSNNTPTIYASNTYTNGGTAGYFVTSNINSVALTVTNTGSGMGLYATSSGGTAGGFSSNGDRTLDVQNTATNGVTHVFRLLNYYNSGTALYAINATSTGTGYTSWFETGGTGKAIYAYGPKATTVVDIRADSGSAIALYARTTSTSGGAIAGWFTAASGTGVDADGTTYGVSASASATTGYGVSGSASSSSGANYGVYGTSASSSGYGGYFENGSTGWGMFSNDDVGIYANGYINFGTSHGSGGYGLRDSSGTMQYKNSGGSWTSFGAASTSPAGTICGNRFTQCTAGTPAYDSSSSPATCGGNTLTATCSGSVVSAVSGCPAGYTGKWTLNAVVSSFVYTTIFCVAN